MTAAHKSLPIGSSVTVHNRGNGRPVTVPSTTVVPS
jgi:rare lipoprotein A (peptidoglycan hydrolase)